MKKSYISPTVKVVELDGEQILAGSVGFGDGEVNSGDAKDFYFDLDEGNTY